MLNMTTMDTAGRAIPRPRRRFSIREGHRAARA